jgi:hypothetical protein
VVAPDFVEPFERCFRINLRKWWSVTDGFLLNPLQGFSKFHSYDHMKFCQWPLCRQVSVILFRFFLTLTVVEVRFKKITLRMALDIFLILTMQLDLKCSPLAGANDINKFQFQCWTEYNRFEMKLN